MASQHPLQPPSPQNQNPLASSIPSPAARSKNSLMGGFALAAALVSISLFVLCAGILLLANRESQPDAADAMTDLPSYSFKTDSASFNAALQKYKRENGIPLHDSNWATDGFVTSKVAEPRTPAEQQLRQWCRDQFKKSEDVLAIPFSTDAFHAAILRSPHGDLSFTQKLELSTWVQDSVPYADLSERSKILAVDFASHPDGSINEELATIHFLSEDGISQPDSLQWFVIKERGSWKLYDWRLMSFGRRVSDEYADFVAAPDDVREGYDEALALLGNAWEAYENGELRRAKRSVLAAQQKKVTPINRIPRALQCAWTFESIGEQDLAISQLIALSGQGNWGIEATLARFLRSDGVDQQAVTNAIKSLEALSPDHPTTHELLAELQAIEPEDDSTIDEATVEATVRSSSKHAVTAWRLLPQDYVPMYSWLPHASGSKDLVSDIFDVFETDALSASYWSTLLSRGSSDEELATEIKRRASSSINAPSGSAEFASAVLYYAKANYNRAASSFQNVLKQDTDQTDNSLAENARQWIIDCYDINGELARFVADSDDPERSIFTLIERWWSDELYLDEEQADEMFDILNDLPDHVRDSNAALVFRGLVNYYLDRNAETETWLGRYLDSIKGEVLSSSSVVSERDNPESTEDPDSLLFDEDFQSQVALLHADSIIFQNRPLDATATYSDNLQVWIAAALFADGRQDQVMLNTLLAELKLGSEDIRSAIKLAFKANELTSPEDSLEAADLFAKSIERRQKAQDSGDDIGSLYELSDFQRTGLAETLVRHSLFNEQVSGAWQKTEVLRECLPSIVTAVEQYRDIDSQDYLLKQIEASNAGEPKNDYLIGRVIDNALARNDRMFVQRQLARYLNEWPDDELSYLATKAQKLIKQLAASGRVEEAEQWLSKTRWLFEGDYESIQRLISICKNKKIEFTKGNQDLSDRQASEVVCNAAGLLQFLDKRLLQLSVDDLPVVSNNASITRAQGLFLRTSRPIKLDKDRLSQWFQQNQLTVTAIQKAAAGPSKESPYAKWYVACDKGHLFELSQHEANEYEGHQAPENLKETLNQNRFALEISACSISQDPIRLAWQLAEPLLDQGVSLITVNQSVIDLSQPPQRLPKSAENLPYAKGRTHQVSDHSTYATTDKEQVSWQSFEAWKSLLRQSANTDEPTKAIVSLGVMPFVERLECVVNSVIDEDESMLEVQLTQSSNIPGGLPAGSRVWTSSYSLRVPGLSE
ncbi:MAG: hypothetical protein AAF664_10825 [Planctomycetota bacterium]